MPKIFILLVLLAHFYLGCFNKSSDPHESISKRTPAGIPYYVKSNRFQGTIYSSTALLILEFSTNTSSLLNQSSQASLYWRYQKIEFEENLLNLRLGRSTPKACQIGDLFHGAPILSQEERESFFDRLPLSGCYSDKFQVHKVENVYFSVAGYNSYYNGYNEAEKWTQAIGECSSKRIPHSLISPSSLVDYLKRFTEAVTFSSELELSISLEDVNNYYQIGIANCALTENSFIVAIQIPVREKENFTPSSMKSYSLVPIPLVMPSDSDTVCFMEDVTDPHFLEGTFLYSSPGKYTFNKEKLLCEDGNQVQLCFVPSSVIEKRSMRRSCVQSLIEALDEDITCNFKCEPAATFNFPIIRRLTSDRYLIVADLKFNEEIRVECPPFQKEETLTFPATGALEIILPCDCHLRYQSLTFKSSTPCGAEFSKIPINFPGVYDIRDNIDD